MRNKIIAACVIAVLVFGLIAMGNPYDPPEASASSDTPVVSETPTVTDESGGMTLDKRILVTEANISAIMEKSSRAFFGDHPVTEEFLFYVAKRYGDDVLKKVVENREYNDPEVWYLITGKSIHVLYQEYVRYVGIDAWDYSHVHEVKLKGSDATFVFSGDVTIHEDAATTNYMDSCANGIRDCFSSDLLEIMEGADVFVVNNEFCYSKQGEPTPGKDYTFRANPKRVKALKEIGTDLACLANNHVFDYGETALSDTLKTLKDAGVPYIGAGENLDEASRIQYYIVGGRKVSIVNATQIERSTTFTREATESQSGVFKTLNPDNCVKAIRRAKKNSDICIVVVHWGTEGNRMYGGDQSALALSYVDAGADAIVGGHTHCLQGIEYIGEVPVYYSLGNYWFATSSNMPEDYDTGLAMLTVTQEGKIKPSFVPARFHGGVTSLCTGDEATRIYDLIGSVSQSTTINDKGKIQRR